MNNLPIDKIQEIREAVLPSEKWKRVEKVIYFEVDKVLDHGAFSVVFDEAAGEFVAKMPSSMLRSRDQQTFQEALELMNRLNVIINP